MKEFFFGSVGGQGLKPPFEALPLRKLGLQKLPVRTNTERKKHENRRQQQHEEQLHLWTHCWKSFEVCVFLFFIFGLNEATDPQSLDGEAGGVYVLSVKSPQSLRCHNITANTSREAVNRARCCGFRDHSKMPENAFLSPYHPNTKQLFTFVVICFVY